MQWFRPVSCSVAVVLVVGCSGSDSDVVSEAAQVTAPVVVADEQDELFTPGSVVVESLPAVSETGVPGIDSDDAFCRAWSAYAGSVQGIALAWAVQSPVAAARLETAASNAVIDAVAQMSAQLPAAIEPNRQALTVDVPGPMLRRAEQARDALAAAGADDAQIAALGDAWIAAITAAGLDSDTVSIVAPPGTDAALDEATAFVVDNLVSFNEDPTLDTTEFDISPSLAYIADTCPDQGTLAGNDGIGGDGF